MKKSFLLLVLLPVLLLNCTRNEFESNNKNDLADHYLENDIFAPLVDCDVKFITLENGMKMIGLDSLIIDQGDMALSDWQLAMLADPLTRGSVLDDYTKQWPNGIVFYNVGINGGYSTPDRTAVREYLDYLESVTNLRFWESVSIYPNYVSIIGDKNNLSNIGMIGGRQYLRLYNLSALPHEMLHAVGFGHEQGRKDRDQYIVIKWDNIQEQWRYAYDYNHSKYNLPMHDEGIFDFNSIMLYNPYNSFAIDLTKPTMTKRDGTSFSPNYSTLSVDDIAMINKKYPSKYAYDILPLTLEMANESGSNWNNHYKMIGFVASEVVTKDTRIGIHVYTIQYDGYGNQFEYNSMEYATIPAGQRYVQYKFVYQNFTHGGDIDDWTTTNNEITGYDLPLI